MLLPNGEQAEIDPRKLTDYCLSTTHLVGKHKAYVFRKVLGITASEAFFLRDLLLEAAIDGEAILERVDDHGEKYRIDFEVSTTTGQALVRSTWIIPLGEKFPRLTTCFVLPR